MSAKARVASLRQTTIPRLKLMAALIAARLAKPICTEFRIKPSKVVLWSDSMIVLAWLRSESTMFKSFVGVRVAEIQTVFEPTFWRYVPSSNSADDLSRGISAQDMNGRWMNGPLFLRKEPKEWPSEVNEIQPELPELKVNKALFVLQPFKSSAVIDPSRYSNRDTIHLKPTTEYFMQVENAPSAKPGESSGSYVAGI